MDERRGLVEDPWVLYEFSKTVAVPSAESQRAAVVHLLHPDTFEPIVSSRHKNLIIDRYRHLAGGETDLERALAAIRRGLEPVFGPGFHYYLGTVVRTWQKDDAWAEFLKWIRALRALPDFDQSERDYKLQAARALDVGRRAVLDAAPDWVSVFVKAFKNRHNNLTDYRYHNPFLRWVQADPDAGRTALLALWSEAASAPERIDGFVSALHPGVLDQRGARLNIATYLLIAEDVMSLPPAKVNAIRSAWRLAGWPVDTDEMTDGDVYARALSFFDELVHDGAEWPAPMRDRLDAQGTVWLLASRWVPASWSEQRRADLAAYLAGIIEPEPSVSPEPASEADHVARAAEDLLVPRESLEHIVALLRDRGQVVLYGPPGTGKTFLAKRLARALAEEDDVRWAIVQFHPATTYEDFIEGLRPKLVDGAVTYELTPGPLVRIAARAAERPDQKFVLVIDEINRANLPKVLGELLFLLEYRTERVQLLYRGGETFSLPWNLWFIGTMNTADRSIALIDAAMRRRFHFVPFFPHRGEMRDLLRRWLAREGHPASIASFVDDVNAELRDRLGEHLLLGPSFFMKDDLSPEGLKRIWEHNVFPFFEELFWGSQTEVDRWRWEAVCERHRGALGIAAPSDAGDAESAAVAADLDAADSGPTAT